MSIPTKTRNLIRERDGGMCRRCGRRGTNVQHRIGRGSGGSKRAVVNDPSALVTLCGSGTTECHGEITEHPAEAYETGWAIRRSDPRHPSEIPLVDLLGREFLLASDGTVTYLEFS